MAGCIKKPRSCGVHDGAFHADEVTAVALLIEAELVDLDKVIRTRDPRLLEACDFVCDVGGQYDLDQRLFDHHQIDYQGSLSSAGMVLEYLINRKYIDRSYGEYLRQGLVHGVDLIDTGAYQPQVSVCTFSGVIANFVIPSYQALPKEMHEAFCEAVRFVCGFLQRARARFIYAQSCRDHVCRVMQSMDHCLIFDEPMPWLEAFFTMDGVSHPAEFVIMPTGAHWKLRGVPPSYEKKMQVRVPLPVAWAGLMDADLKKITQIPGAIFCHKERFISIWETKEDALRALKLIVREKQGVDNL